MRSKRANPQLVTLARQARGLTQSQLANQAGTRQATISKIEAGLAYVSGSDIEPIAHVLRFPVHFFTQDTRWIEGPTIPEYTHRKRAKASVTTLHKLHALATIRQVHIGALLKSWEGPGEFPKYPVEDFDANPKRIAQSIRAAWRVPPGPIFNITELVERAGAIVISFDFGTRDIDGFSRFSSDSPPVIFINSRLLPDRWRYTVAHETGHLVMHSQSDPYPDMEADANAFASELLMPSREISSQLTRVTIDRLAGLKRYWKVSMQAIIVRARDLHLITPNQERYLFMQLSKAGYRLREPPTLDPPAEEPMLLRQIVKHHRRNLGYSISDLCNVLALAEEDLRQWYLTDEPHLRALN